MELFILAAVSLTIAVSLLIKKEKDAVQVSLALLCLALFLHKGGTFFNSIFEDPFWRVMSLVGFLFLPPLLVEFSRNMLSGKTFLSRKEVAAAAVLSLLWAVAFFTPFARSAWFEDALLAYLFLVILYCFAALLLFIRGRAPGVERTRMVYVAMACAITAVVSLLDIFYYMGFRFPPVSNLALAGLLYFVLIIILHPRLPELYEIMVRGLVVSVVTLFATSVFFFILGLFGTITPVYFTHVLTASFIIVISYDPFRVIMKKVFNYFFPEAKDIFSSIYGFDQELEKEKSQLLEEMATALAHEIRNPLGSIKGAGQYLRSETDNAENQKLLDVIIEETDRLNNVVTQFMNYAKPYAVNPKMYNVNGIIEKAVTVIRASELPAGIRIETELNPDLPEVCVDGEQMKQIILNIAFNGIEAMPDGGTLTIRTTRIESEEGEAVGISIRDTGKGMSGEDLQNIFKPFFTTKERGVGLGLSICQRIAKNNNGSIRAKSIPGQGSIFYIRLNLPQG
jgi:two-component system, NtrC family, sensor histidine kinase HydH